MPRTAFAISRYTCYGREDLFSGHSVCKGNAFGAYSSILTQNNELNFSPVERNVFHLIHNKIIPIFNTSSIKLFNSLIVFTVVLFSFAIEYNVSPFFTI